MQDDFNTAVEDLIRKAPAGWLTVACEALRSFPTTATIEFVLQRLPSTNNADLAFLATETVRRASGMMSWEALSWTLETTYATFHRIQGEQQIELLWSGPSPADQIPARRIDQALYDLIAKANREILLVTFAAVRIERLADELLRAAQRGVKLQLILEFEEASEGQLSYDALHAFPPALSAAAEVYYWPVEKRERNQAGRPGKLHAKLAIVDGAALLSSANLTDDAFTRNLELGVMVKDREFLRTTQAHINTLISDGTFRLLKE
jgi:phosphatidylserine/phosphatidylglycerophosphate/cardiolipin synthase-like enzyme